MFAPIPAGDRVPVYRPFLGAPIQEAARAALEEGWLGMGRLSQQFELRLEEYLDLDGRRVVATNSCTEALHLCARLIGLGPGDEVIAPAFTYVAGHQAITQTGADVVFCDVEDRRLGIDPARVEELITGRTGPSWRSTTSVCPASSTSSARWRSSTDADHRGRGPRVRLAELGSSVGSFGDLTCFSFGPVRDDHHTGGGAVVTPHDADVQVLHELRHLGIDADTDARHRNQRNWEFDVVRQGYRCHLGSVPAAIGLASSISWTSSSPIDRTTAAPSTPPSSRWCRPVT
jgi:dTDP-4-amino-4,6-dideoxygalactose transaminase